jgi:threonine dehydrogenase-like Zn-dependent dehydrogenase
VNSTGFDGCQSEFIRIPQADGTLFATPDQPDDDPIPHRLALSDVMSAPGRGGRRPARLELPVREMFFRNVGIKDGPASMPTYPPDLLDRVLVGTIEPGLVFDLQLPLDQVADAYAVMDQRRAIKALLQP